MNRYFLLLILAFWSAVCFSDENFFWFNDPAFQQALDQQTRSKSYRGNKITLLPTGLEAFNKRKENAEKADAIFIKTYEWDDDKSGNEIVDYLIERAQKGTKVFVQFDVRGTWETYEELNQIAQGKLNPIPPSLQRLLDRSYGNCYVIPTSIPTTSFASEPLLPIPNEHEKYWITWEYKKEVKPVKVILGSRNVGDVYFLQGKKDETGKFLRVPDLEKKGVKGNYLLPWRELDIEIIGPVNNDIVIEFMRAADYQIDNTNQFFQKNLVSSVQKAVGELKCLLKRMRNNPDVVFPRKAGRAFARFLVTPPHSPSYENNVTFDVNAALLLMIDNIPKNTQVYFFGGSFFLPPKPLSDALLSAAKRGVVFHVLVNKTDIPDAGMANNVLASRCQMRYFLQNAPESFYFYEWQGRDDLGLGVTHMKMYVFGEEMQAPFAIGSFNINSVSWRWGSENLLLIQSSEIKDQINALVKNDFSSASAHLLTQSELEKEPEEQKAKECEMQRKMFKNLQ